MDTKIRRSRTLWVDWKNRILSFRKAAGFEKLTFKTRSDMLAYAVEKSNAGFYIQ